MGFIFGLLKRLIILTVAFLIFAAFIVFVPNLPPYAKFSSIELEPTQPRIGPLAPNEALNNAEKLYEGKLEGPEAFEVYNGEVYTSLATGEVVKLSPGGHITFVTKIGQPCKGHTEQQICGRPLGLQIDEKKQELYVADVYHGIWKVNLKSNKKQLLVSPRVSQGDRPAKQFNCIALAENGDLFWTDSSSDYFIHDGVYATLVDPAGRLFHYIAAKNESKVLLDNLWYANGVAISPDNQFVVVAETVRFRLLKYYIDGPKKGTSEVFAAGLPGIPDNLRALPDGSGLLAALYSSFDDDQPLILKSMAQTPLVRKFLARLFRLIEIPFEFCSSYYPNAFCDEVVFHIGHFQGMSSLAPKLTGLVQLDWNGKVVASYYNTDGSVRSISDAIVYNDKLYMGTPNIQNYVAAVPAPPLLKKAFAAYKPPSPKTAETNAKSKPKTVEAPKGKEEKIKVVKPVETQKPAPAKDAPKQADSKPTQPKPSQTKPQDTTPPPQQKTVPKTSPPKTEPKVPTEKPPTTKPMETPPPTKQTQSPEVNKATQAPPSAKPAPASQPTPAPPLEKPTPATPSAKPSQAPPTAKPTQAPPSAKPTQASESTKSTQAPPSAKPTQATPSAKPTKAPPSAKPTSAPPTAKPSNSKPEIPIKEEIISDTAKPNKETLKVIKKNGPAEIPNPSL